MTRDEAKAWFEARVRVPRGPGSVEGEDRKAYGLAIEALAQPEVVTLRPGEVAILQFKHRLSSENVERIRRQWQEYTGGKPPIVLDGDIRVGGKVATESYEVPAVPL